MATPLNSVDPGVKLVRRRCLLTVATAAAVGGFAVAWHQSKQKLQDHQGVERFWQSTFVSPVGDRLAMSTFQMRPLLLNFWATWCPPCVAEFQLLDSFYLENAVKSWQVLGLALDNPVAVQRFLTRSPVSFPIAIGGADGAGLGKSLGNEMGGLPFSVVFGPDGLIRYRKIGILLRQDLQAWRDAM